MKMLSERGFNIHMFPMIPKKGRVFEGEYVRKNRKGETVFIAAEGSKWNLRCYKFMDWLSTKLRTRFDDNTFFINSELGIIKHIYDHRLSEYVLLTKPKWFYDVVDGVQNRFSKNEKLARPYKESYRIYYKDVSKDLKWEKKHVKETIEMISKCKFKTRYNFQTTKINNNRTTGNFDHGYTNLNSEFDKMFNVLFNKNTDFDNGDCLIVFNTSFSICFLHNLFTGGYQLIDNNLYNLSESSQLVYRQRFFTYGNLKFGTYLNIEWVMNFLNNNSPNKTAKVNLFKKIINELISINGIEIKRKVSDTNYHLTYNIKKQNKIIPIGINQ
jgi:hypothetical protein